MQIVPQVIPILCPLFRKQLICKTKTGTLCMLFSQSFWTRWEKSPLIPGGHIPRPPSGWLKLWKVNPQIGEDYHSPQQHAFVYLFLCDIIHLSALFSIPGPFRCSALLFSKSQGIVFVTLHCLRASGLALSMGCRGGGLERGGGEKSGYFSTYSDCTCLCLWFLLDCPMTHSAAPHHESSPHWKVLAVGVCPACPIGRTQGEGTKGGPRIYVQYFKVIHQIQTVKVFSIFLFGQTYLHSDKLKEKNHSFGNPQDKYPYSLTH